MPRHKQIYLLLITFIFVISLLLVGCSINPIRVTVVKSNRLQEKEKADLSQMILDNEPQLTEYLNSRRLHSTRQIANNSEQRNYCRVKYHPSYSTNYPIMVEGRLNNGRKYPVVLDTGASPPFFINDIHILENNLPIQPLSTACSNSIKWGKSHISVLHIGQVVLTNCPCFYQEQHTELQLFGLPIVKDKSIIAGLPALRRFKYIAFDGVKKEVEFSIEKVFDTENPKSWQRYPFTIEEDLTNNAFLFVRIPIEDEEIELQLDTGSGKGLAIGEKLWQRLSRKIRDIKLHNATELYPYIGLLTCEQGVITKLKVGLKTIEDAKISIFPDNSPLLDRCEGLLGMQYFQDKILVLDFACNLMWVKNPQS